MSAPEVEISDDLQQWAEPFFDYNSETYNPLAVLERIAALEAQVGELEGTLPGRMLGCQALADEKCKWFLIRAETAEAQVQQLREALTKIRDRDSDCECDDHTSLECCANIEWNDGSCCPHCVAGAALAATEPK